MPGVKAAAFGWGVPLTGNKWELSFVIDGQPGGSAIKDQLNLQGRSVTPDYFDALGLKLVEGRAFRSADNQQAPRVAILNQAAAQRFFPGALAVGRKLKFSGTRTRISVIIIKS